MSNVFVFICTRTRPDFILPQRGVDQDEHNRRVANALKKKKLAVGDLTLRITPDAIPDHLLCDGSAISRTQFGELFRLLGESQGAGDGATTFNLPNYLGSPLIVPATAPTQIITASGTVESAVAVVVPAGQTGGTRGGNIPSGGRVRKVS